MSLQTDKRDLTIKLNRYMTLLSNLDKPPTDYIGDLRYMKGLIQIANDKEYQTLFQDWETIRPKDQRSAVYVETGKLGDGRAVEMKSLIDLTFQIMLEKGPPYDQSNQTSQPDHNPADG